MTSLLSWLDRGEHHDTAGRGIRFARPGSGWDLWPYPRLARQARAAAAALAARGAGPGDVVGIVVPSGPSFVTTLFGALAAGAAASPLAPPDTFTDPARYADHLTGALAVMRPRLLVVDPAAAPAVAPVAARAGIETITPDALLAGDGARPVVLPAPDPGRIALLQFTSGTSGRVRAVRVPFAALTANVAAIQAWLEMTPADPTASWLPVHHDMGLVGCLLAPVVTGSDLWLMPPAEFVRRPSRFLECFGRHGARLTAMPGFGLAHVTRRVRPEQLDGMDLSRWRAVIVGAERILPAVLDGFARLCAPHGFDPRALLPAYGLAEATLAVTGLPLRTGRRLAPGPDGIPVVGCGTPLGGARVSVVDDHDRPLPDGQVGQIVVGGPSVADGYADGADFTGGRVRTGDAGFTAGGELFVLGRLGDSLKVRGRAVFAEDLDAALAAGLGTPAGRVVTTLGYEGDTATVVVFLEHPRPGWAERVPGLLRPFVDDAEIRTVRLRSGDVPRTTSGKPKRRLLWQNRLRG